MYFFHPEPVPGCDVCDWIQQNGADQLMEHTKTRLCIGLMIDDLLEAERPMHMLQLHRAGIGFPGPDHPLEPRHWLWALMVVSSLMITLDKQRFDEEGLPA